ncbi:MAG: hypothetical protein WCC06_05380 [Candidatus Aminicenantales bacterium]
MKIVHHKNLTLERWQKLSFCEQMANIGSEVFRTISWRQKNQEYSRLALERALELLDLTIEAAVQSRPRLRELTRLREALIDYFLCENIYRSSDKNWQNYFGAFNYAAKNPSAKK